MEYREGQTATNPKTGQKLKYEGGFWVAVPGTGPSSKAVPSNEFAREQDTLRSLSNLRQRSTWDNTGTIGGMLRGVPGWNAYNFAADVDTLKARNAFGELSAMRRASPTGGALGGIAVPELQMLQATSGNLDPAQGEKQFDENLDRVRQAVIARTPGLTEDNPFDLSGGQSRTTIPIGAMYRDPQGNIRRNDNSDAGNPIIVPVRKPAATAPARAAPPPPLKPASVATTKPPVKVRTVQEAEQLPPNTRFVLPDGRSGTKR